MKHYLKSQNLRRAMLLIVVSWLLGGLAFAIPVQINLTVGINDPFPGIPELHKGPEYVPSVVLDGYEITFLAIHPAYTLNIVANGVVVYSVALSPYTTSVVLPSWLSGQYEIQLRPDDYYYLYGYIEL
jgi:hypothetical protein